MVHMILFIISRWLTILVDCQINTDSRYKTPLASKYKCGQLNLVP